MKKAFDRICAMPAMFVWLMVFISSNLFGQSEIDQKLFQAVLEGDTLQAEELLKQGADPNSDFEGQALFFYAIENHDLEMVEFLSSRGADINKRNGEGQSPLMFCLQEMESGESENPEVAIFLINNGASLKAKGKYSLLHRAADYGYPGSIVEALIENGADINAKDKQKNTPLFYAMINYYEEVAIVIARYGPSLDFTLEIEEGVAPLTYALSEFNSDELVESFVRHGADFNHKDEDFLSPLELAVGRGFYRSVGVMLQKGADPDRLVEDLPLLIYVIEKEEIDTYDDTLLFGLVEQGANVNVEYEGQQLASYLIDASSSYKLDSVVFWNCNSDELELATIDLLLSEAALEGDPETVQKLVSVGASLNPKTDNDPPALYFALWGCSYEVVELLVEAGSDVNATDSDGDTPLHELFNVIGEFRSSAVGEYISSYYLPKINPMELQRFPEKTIRLFVAHGANVNAKDSYGFTPLARAKEYHPQLAKLLIELGAVEEP